MSLVKSGFHYALAALFLYAGGIKALDPSSFAGSIATFGVPHTISAALALYLPWVELAIGVGCLFPSYRTAAVLLSVIALTFFLTAYVYAASRGLAVSCGCFGKGETIAVGFTFFRTGGLLMLGWWLLLQHLGLGRRERRSPWPSERKWNGDDPE